MDHASPDKPVRVRRFVRWLKDKVENRRGRGGDTDPWWVTLLLDVGRPLVAVMILTMCAPGEHYLAVQAGWSETLAWGMPGTLTAYAGIAAVVATQRSKGFQGRKTAIWGAVVSVALAMSAQPVAHLYGRTGLTFQLVVLTCVMGVIPAAVFGHLLHMGASGKKPDHPMSEPRPEQAGPKKPSRPKPVRPVSEPRPAPSGDDLGQKRDLTELVRRLRTEGQDEEQIKELVRGMIPDVKPDSLSRAVRRTRIN